MEFENGNAYFGSFLSRKHGKCNQYHGRGTYVWKNAGVYEGFYQYNKFHGNGRLIDKHGNIFEGEWVNDQLNGNAKIIYSSGNLYEGDM